ncbi:gliding motility-associated protein GldE [uncultured Fibrella sp.]|uniref:gliding motility-associated protein GldE n=1 Tax=uncultured Fibrella sp. TaxID=1284596 RepID=UPI0035CB9B82
MDPGDPSSTQVLPVGNNWSTYLSFYGPYVAVVLLLLFLAALASAAEAAFFTLTPQDRAQCRDSEAPAYQRIAAMLERPRRLLASLVILNNLLNIAIVLIVTYVTWIVTGVSHGSGWLLAAITLATTLVIVVFGEMVPKIYAAQYALAVANRTLWVARSAMLIFTPISSLLVSMSNQVDKRIHRRGYKLSAEELSEAVELTGTSSSEEEKELLKGIVNFSNLTARQVMRARMDITAFPDDLPFPALLEQLNDAGYSRVPIYKETIDQIEGVLYLKDLLPHLASDDSFNWTSLLRPVFFIPETKKVDDLLQDFQRKRVHMAIVVDEYGGTRGLVTLEDIIEEIFGDINDEFDEETPTSYRRIDEQTVIFEGRTPLTDVCRVLDVDPTAFDEVRGDSESLGGLLLELFSRLPKTGEEITFDDFNFHVLAADDKRISEVRVTQQDLTEK